MCESRDDGRSHWRLRSSDRAIHEDNAALSAQSSHSLSLRRMSLVAVCTRGEEEGVFGEVSMLCLDEG